MSRKQPTVGLSLNEPEYKATVKAGKELAWIRTIFEDFRIVVPTAMPIHNNNQGAIALADNPVFRARCNT